MEASAVIPPGGGAVTGWAALAWRGARWFTGEAPDGATLPVQLATWDDVREQPGFAVCHERLDPREVEIVDGLPVTSAIRTVWFLMRYAASVRQAVVVADMAAYDDLAAIDELWDYAWAHTGWVGSPQARDALVLADENAWSPREVAVRWVWEAVAGLSELLTNRPVFTRSGRHIATPDLLDVESGLAIEYDGALHLDGQRRRADRDREERMRSVGIEVLTVLAGDALDVDRLAARMRAARSRARWEPVHDRAWTLAAPPYWTSTHTVALRRALDGPQRDRLLGYRRVA